MAKGGKQPGAGRPLGSTTKVRISDYFTEAEKKDFFNDLKVRAQTDTKIALYLAEQLTGKATQNVELGGLDGQPIVVKVMNYGNNPAV